MTVLKTYYFVVILVLITVSNYHVQLAADEIKDEGKQAVFQEFIKMAEDFEKQNNIDDAIEIYERIIKADPKNLESHTKLATLYTQTKNHEKAAQIWERLIEIDPDNTKYQESLINSLKADGRDDEAIEIIEAYIQMQPDVGIHYARLATLYADLENEDVAIKNYEKATELGYGEKDIHLKFAELYYAMDNVEGAENALKNAILVASSDWDRQNIEKRLINLYRSQGNLAQKLLKADDEDNNSIELQKELGQIHLSNGEFEKAAEAYGKALDMTRDQYARNRVAESLIKAYIKQGRTDLAITFYDSESKKFPRNTSTTSTYGSGGITTTFGGDEIRKSLINAYKNQGKLDEIKSIFKGKYEKGTANPAVIEMLAEIYWNAEEHQKSAETYQLLNEAEPKNVRSLYLAAVAYQKINQPDKAIEILNQAYTALKSSNHRSDTSFLGAMATICQKNKMYDAAIKLANDAITEAEKRDNKWGLNYHYNILAKSYHGAKQYEDAFKSYQNVIKFDEHNYMKRTAEPEMKKIAKEGKLYEKWIPEQIKKVTDNPNNIEFILELAESYEANDNIEEAVTQYERLAELDSDNPEWYKKLGHYYQTMLPTRSETGEIHEGTALTLSGNGSYVEMNDSESLDKITNQVTVSAWIKPTSFPNNYVRIIFRSDEKKQNYRQRSYILAIRSDGKLKITSSPKDEGYASLYSAPGLIKLNKWTHIAGVIDSRKNYMKIFIDGKIVGNRHYNGQSSFVSCRLPLRIGVTHIPDQVQNTSFIGQIDEVRVWNKPRTEEEIRSDMNRQLNGDEPGLVGYWKFDEEKDGNIFDATPNKNDGKLIGDAKIASYTRPVFERLRSDQYTKSIEAYQIAIGLEPTSYQLYDKLAQTYVLAGQTAKAEETYQQVLGMEFRQNDYESAIQAISKLYYENEMDDKIVPILEEIEPRMEKSAFLYELLGANYKKVGENVKSEDAYAKWLSIRLKELNQQNSYYQLHNFAVELLDKNLFPETALRVAKRAHLKNTYPNYSYLATVGLACIANGLYDDALKFYNYEFTVISDEASFGRFWGRITDYGKKVKDKGRYYEMLDSLADSIPSEYTGHRIEINRILVKLRLAKYYSQNNMLEKAMKMMQQTGIVAENVWLTLGPFDNTAGIGYNTEYFSEDSTQLDMIAKFEGVNEQIKWIKFNDDAFDGYIDFSPRGNWCVSYAWTTITSPDERQVQFRFDSDDQGKMWLNGEEIYANTQDKTISLDREIIPVTLKAGKNSILVKVCNEEKESGFYLRITDTDGKPFKDLNINDIQDK